MASTGVWSDFEAIRHSVKNNTVDKLKQILSGINDECNTHIPKTGKKQEVIDRIVSTLDTWRTQNHEARYLKAKAIITQVRNTGFYAPSRMAADPVVLPPPTVPNHSLSSIMKTNLYATIPGSSSLPRYDPYAPPRKPSGPQATSSPAKPMGLRFKDSPFFKVDQAVSGVIECPESTGATDRRQQTLTFTLTNDHLSKLKPTNGKYQLRLFCTSSIFYCGPNSLRASNALCPIEFPPTCEVRVNSVQLAANLKGLKKKPGTAPPPDIGKYCRLSTLANKIEMVYVNSQQPIQPKKYYLVVMLVEATTVDHLVSDLKNTKYRSSHSIRQSVVASLAEDDDIVAGPQKMSLKCPLSFMRVNTPCRSSRCVHSQCFDATSWFSVMEQTTTWLCPVCERILDCGELIIDGYFDEILKQTPDSAEDVIVEADGEWHTSDNKYGSVAWRTSHPSPAALNPEPPSIPRPSSPSTSRVDANGKVITSSREIFVLDSDDEDEGQVKRELSLPLASGSQLFDNTSVPQTQTQTESIIDLTADSDDEEPPTTRAEKRKAADHEPSSASPTEQVWKKSRIDTLPPPPPPPPPPHHPGNDNTVDYSAPTSHGPTSIPPLRYINSYQGSHYPNTTSTSPSASHNRLSLPGINSILPGANGRWP